MYNLKLAFRNLFRQRSGTLINVIGLSLSLAVCLLIALFVQYEYSFEKHNPDAKNIYRLLNVNETDKNRNPIHPIASFHPFSDAVPELKKGTMVQYLPLTFFVVNNEQMMLQNVMFTDNEFFQMFNIRILEGGENPLSDDASAVISRSEAEKLFPNTPAVGKTIRYENRYDFQIKGVFEDAPLTANYRPNVIMNIHAKKEVSNYEYTAMRNQSVNLYFHLPKNVDLKSIEEKVLTQAKIIYDYPGYDGAFQFQSLKDIHLLSSDTLWDTIERSDEKIVQLFTLVATLLLLVAMFNFINLSVALRSKRNFNTGMQKIMGADTKNIFGYLFTETSLLISFCLAVALFLTEATLPYFNQLMDTQILFSFANPVLWISIGVITILTIFIPVFFQLQNQLRVNPSATIRSKGHALPKKGNISVAQTLTIAQIAISICLIIGVIAINQQFDLLLQKKLGFDKENLVTVNNPWNDKIENRYALYKQELEKLPIVSGVTATWNTPGYNLSNGGTLEYELNGEKVQIRVRQSPVDGNFFDVMRTSFLAGTSFASTDSSRAIINQKCQQLLNVENPIGMKVTNLFIERDYEICGVIEDIQNRSLQNESQPVIYYLYPQLSSIVVRLEPGNLQQSIAELEAVWKRIEPDQPFRMSFVDEDLAANYKREIRTQKLLTIFSLLAIFISMLGLYGLSMQIILRRTKEIGIRKVNGATISEILSMLNKRFVIWVLVAFVVAVPLVYYAMKKWLETFAYKTELSWWIFALGGLATLLVALFTVSWQSWHAATKNPVEALRYE
ncbi:MAG: ABC transporter permease [Bacteroidia bacterium]|nr:ABC transporter permease [Bacteroidia bacterium]